MRITILLILLGFFSETLAQNTGKPFIRNFTPEAYNAYARSRDIVRDGRGMIYASNFDGLLEFDGERWRSIPVSDGSSVTSMCIAPDGVIYIGAVGQFGCIMPDRLGRMRYVSLSSKLPGGDRKFQDIIGTAANSEGVYFNTDKDLFIYSENRARKLIGRFQFSREVTSVGDRVFACTTDFGMVEIVGEKVKRRPGGEFFAQLKPVGILAYDKNRILTALADGTLHLYDPKTGEISPALFPAETLQLLSENGLGNALRLPGDRYAFFLKTGGLIITNILGEMINKIDDSDGLPGNVTHRGVTDEHGGLWLSLNNGISRVEIESPYSFWDEDKGLPDMVLSVRKYRDTLYAGTFKGVYALQGDRFEQLPGYNTACRSLLDFSYSYNGDSIYSALLAATDEGLFALENGLISKKLSDKKTVSLFRSPKFPNRLYAGQSGGYYMMELRQGEWQMVNDLDTLQAEVRCFAEEDNGDIWAGTAFQGVLKTIYAGAIDARIATFQRYDTLNGLPGNNRTNVYRFDDDFLFATDNGYYRFEPKSRRFFRDTLLNKNREKFSAYKMSPTPDGRWLAAGVTNQKGPIEFIRKNKNSYSRDDRMFRRLPQTGVEVVHADSDGLIWIGGSEGLFRYNPKGTSYADSVFNVYLREIQIGEDSVIFHGAFHSPGVSFGKISAPAVHQSPDNLPAFDYEYNAVLFRFGAAAYENSEDIQYSWQLDEVNKNWSPWAREPQKAYTNLPPGEYTFRLKARNLYGTESAETVFRFSIIPPWYLTSLAKILYIMAALLSVYMVSLLLTRRLVRRNEELERLVNERTAQMSKQKDEIQFKNTELDRLNREIQGQNEEIIQSYQNTVLLTEIGRQIISTLSTEKITEIAYRNINRLMNAKVFAIGVYNDQNDHLEFSGAIKEDKVVPLFAFPVNDENRFSLWAFLKDKEVFVNNIETDYKKYTDEIPDAFQESKLTSMIFVPISDGEKVVGVVTVQNDSKNSYSDYHLSVLKNLSVYIVIALKNAETYRQIEKQNSIIETRNRDITSGINYAARLQNSVMPDLQRLGEILPESFVFLKPRDIVSGDFYWFCEKDDLLFLAAVDCTGHGVPGAIMSMIGLEQLTEIVNVNNITSPDLILNGLHSGVKQILKQEKYRGREGMDIALCVIDRKNLSVSFSGAKNPLVVVKGNELLEVPADRRSVGDAANDKRGEFSLQNISFTPEEAGKTWFYIFSDGFQDQFGGPENRKYMKKRFKKFLSEMAGQDIPPAQQEILLLEELEKWRGTGRQVDDILVMGFKIG